MPGGKSEAGRPQDDQAEQEVKIDSFGSGLKEALEKAQQEKFERILKDRLDTFPDIDSKTDIEGLESLSVLKFRDPKTQKITELQIMPFWTDRDTKKECHTTFTLNNDGKIMGRGSVAWKKLGIENAELLEEILRDAQRIRPSLYMTVNGEILPAGELGLRAGETSSQEAPEKLEAAAIDPKRIEFFEKMDGLMFAIKGKKEFRGSLGFVFPDRVILESPRVGAAFIVTYEDLGLPNIDGKAIDFNKQPEYRVPENKKREEMFGEYWKRVEGLTRDALKQMPQTRRIIHPDRNDSKWKQKMQEKLEK